MIRLFLLLLVSTAIHAAPPPPLTPPHTARLLLVPVTRAVIEDTLLALPEQLVARARGELYDPAATGAATAESSENAHILRIEVRVRRAAAGIGPVQVKHTARGDAVIVGLVRVTLPMRADTTVPPIIVTSRRGLITVVVHTLAARARVALDTCHGSPGCLRDVAATFCATSLPSTDSPPASPIQLEQIALRCARDTSGGEQGAATTVRAAAFKVAAIVYRSLFALLVITQIGVLIWGTAFSLSFVVVEMGAALEKMAHYTAFALAYALERAICAARSSSPIRWDINITATQSL